LDLGGGELLDALLVVRNDLLELTLRTGRDVDVGDDDADAVGQYLDQVLDAPGPQRRLDDADGATPVLERHKLLRIRSAATITRRRRSRRPCRRPAWRARARSCRHPPCQTPAPAAPRRTPRPDRPGAACRPSRCSWARPNDRSASRSRQS